MASLDRRGLIAVFERLDDALERPQRLCLIGAAAVLSLGHAARQTGDIDVWRPASVLNDRVLARASRSAGIAIDERGDAPTDVYIQVIRPGIVQLPAFSGGLWTTGDVSRTVWEGDRLTVEVAPPAVIAAAKLVRAEDRDLDDCVFLIRSNQTARSDILKAVRAIEDGEASRTAAENMVLLDIMASRRARGERAGMTTTSTPEPIEVRELWTLAVETLDRLLDDDLVLARAVRTRDYRRLYAVATVARRGLDEAMAMTDPDLYQRLSRAIVLMNLKGYGGLDLDKLRDYAGRVVPDEPEAAVNP